MSRSFELTAPDHFTAGAVGAPGQRVFYLQARQGRTTVTLKCEKEHVGGLAEYLASLLVKLGAERGEAVDDAVLLEPVDAAWDVGSLGVGYDDANDRFLIVAKEGAPDDEDDESAEEVARAEPAEAATARFQITRAQAAAFVARARRLVKAGRPICPMCTSPIDPGGHVCPRANGHVVR